MGKKKQINKITEAVAGILGDKVKAKNLKKAKAMGNFVEKLEEKKVALQQELNQKNLSKERADEITRHLETLDKQIKKATDLVEEMDNG